MNERKMSVYINNDKGNIYGEIVLEDYYAIFDPMAVLYDLLYVVDKDTQKFYGIKFNDNYMSHPFLGEREIAHEIKKYCAGIKTKYKYGKNMNLEINAFLIAINEIRESVENKVYYTIGEFEIMKTFSKMKFSLEIESRYDNPYYEDGGAWYKEYEEEGILHLIDETRFDVKSRYDYRSTYFGVRFDMHSVIKGMEKDATKAEEEPLRYNYSCYELNELVYCVWHYLILHEYKSKKCEHCGKYFAVKSFKQKYCSRKSSFPDKIYLNEKVIYQKNAKRKRNFNYSCAGVVKDVKDKLAQRKKTIYNHLVGYYDWQTATNFSNEYLKRINHVIDKGANIDNLKEFVEYLSPDNTRLMWYKEENKVKRTDI